jgi:hypothetical protein
MSDYGEQLKNYGVQLQGFAMQIQNLGMQMPFLMQNIIMQMQNISASIMNIGTQIFNIGTNLSNNFNMNFPMNNNISEKMNMINNNFKCNERDNELMTIFFKKGSTGEKIAITTSYKTTIEELFNLFIIKMGLESKYLEDYIFIYDSRKINPKEKRTIFNYGLRHGCLIHFTKTQYLLGGP